MEEEKVVEIVKGYFEAKGYKLTPEPRIENGIVRLDLFGYEDSGNKIDNLWIECKGDVNFSEILEGLIRVAFAIWCMGGTGILAVPSGPFNLLKNYERFFGYDKRIKIVNVEDGMSEIVL